MEAAQANPNVCGGESRSYIDMGDFAEMFEKRLAAPGKQASGHRLVLTNEQEWYLWQLRDHCTVRQLAQDLVMSRDKITEHKRRLIEQGGPKGARPEWAK